MPYSKEKVKKKHLVGVDRVQKKSTTSCQNASKCKFGLVEAAKGHRVIYLKL